MDAGIFVNDFVVSFERLNDTEEHRMHETEAKSLFLDQIEHPEYEVVKGNLQIGVSERTLANLMDEVNQAHLSLSRRSMEKERTRRMASAMGLVEQQPPSGGKLGKVTDGDKSKGTIVAH